MVDPQGIVERYEGNPILSAEDLPFRCNSVFNAGAVKYDHKYLLLLRVEGLDGRSFFVVARSEDGFHFEVEERPAMVPSSDPPFRDYEEWGIEDPRITRIDDVYYILYTASSRHGARIALAQTRDFEEFQRIGIISEPENKDAALFPQKIDGRFVRFDRPSSRGGENLWISYSPDLIHWGDSRLVMEARPGFWDSAKIGAGAPPIKTERGWLEIYHGVRETAAGKLYRLGCALFDLEDPSRLIGRSPDAILTPQEPYELMGDVSNVVFTCGIIPEPDGQVKIYYGAADTSIGVALASLDDLVALCLEG